MLLLALKGSQTLAIVPRCLILKQFIVRRFGGTLRRHWVSFAEIRSSTLFTGNLGVPHATSGADIYDGYFIPQGMVAICKNDILLISYRRHDHHECLVNRIQLLAVICLTLSRAMTRNEAKYARPEEFRPERFFTAGGELNNDNVQYAFGAGRRICAGRHFADSSLWSAIVTILATLDIVNCKDEQGNDIPVNAKWTSGVTSYVSLYYRVDFLDLTQIVA